MKKFNCIISITILLILSSCSKSVNPADKLDNDNKWNKIAHIEDLDNPKMQFLNEEIGFVYGSVHYNEITLKNTVLERRFSNDTTFVINESNVKITEPDKFPLWKTIDGGRTWKQIKGYFLSSIEDIYFIDEYTGFLVTNYEGVFKTIDGGNHWFRIFGSKIVIHVRVGNSGNISFAYPKEVCFYDKDHGFIYTEGQQKNLFLFTNDGGQSWEFKYVDIRGENYIFPEKGNPIGFSVNSLSFLKTEDGGLTWSVIAEGSVSCRYSFVNVDTGLFLKDRKIYRTDNGGNIFNQLYDFDKDYEWGFQSDSNNKVIFSNLNSIFFLADCKIVRTTDGCSTFEDMLAPDNCYSDFSFPGDQTGFAITQDGIIHKYMAKE